MRTPVTAFMEPSIAGRYSRRTARKAFSAVRLFGSIVDFVTMGEVTVWVGAG